MMVSGVASVRPTKVSAVLRPFLTIRESFAKGLREGSLNNSRAHGADKKGILASIVVALSPNSDSMLALAVNSK